MMSFRLSTAVFVLASAGAMQVACGDSGGGTPASGGSATGGSSAGSSSQGGTPASVAGAGSGGGSVGGAGAMGGIASGGGGSPSGGSAGGLATGGGGAGGGSAGAASGGSGGGGSGWSCPPASMFTMSPLPGATATAERVANAPPADAFNNMGNDFTTVEGPVWIGDALYFSELKTGSVPPARILKLVADSSVTEFIADSGSNGLAVDAAGNLLSANHKAHGIVSFSLPSKMATTLVSEANSKPLNATNDLTVSTTGTIYFTDPSYQNNANPQGATRVYQWAPGDAAATTITDYTMEPNGITLSLDGQTLILGGKSGVKKYPITGGSVAMTGTAFGPSEVTASGVNTDGMTLDCAGNLYVAVAGGANVIVVKPDGTKLGTITIPQGVVTNVAFGGTDHQTLYITAQGSGKAQGVSKIHLNVPGLPY
jgi:gluconolactonase